MLTSQICRRVQGHREKSRRKHLEEKRRDDSPPKIRDGHPKRFPKTRKTKDATCQSSLKDVTVKASQGKKTNATICVLPLRTKKQNVTLEEQLHSCDLKRPQCKGRFHISAGWSPFAHCLYPKVCLHWRAHMRYSTHQFTYGCVERDMREVALDDITWYSILLQNEVRIRICQKRKKT